ncbi:glycoside hydrolase family 18 protein [Piromyces sp. E2]|nr:glycoside hydrolase family 18 protein [Piromyces sp. E2]|eukprot:OUM57310.1 glycoside hydrolase family 18 protein [Piromyces sp. E2]
MEGSGLADYDGNGRKIEEVHKLRAQALNIVRKELKDKMPSISLCLPVNPDVGFNDNALAVIKAMKSENVPIDNISIMAMDYGSSYISRGFYENTINSLEKSYKQSRSIYPDVKMGVIPMIGQNDDGGILTLQDAERIVDYVKSKKYVNTISMWSINRNKNDGEFSSLVKNTFVNPSDKTYRNSYKYSSILKKFLN